jgi:hypothetical protein
MKDFRSFGFKMLNLGLKMENLGDLHIVREENFFPDFTIGDALFSSVKFLNERLESVEFVE